MPPQLRRFAPFILIFFVLIVVIPLIRGSHKSGLSSGDRAIRTKQAMTLIDAGERRYKAANGRYTSHLADLVPGNKKLAGALAIGIGVQLDVSSNGNSYLAQVGSDVLGLVRGRSGDRVSVNNCLVIKNSSGVDCPPVAGKK